MGDLPAVEDEDGTMVPEVAAPSAVAGTRPEPDDEECDGPIVWRDGLWQVDQEGRRLPVDLDPGLKELADSVLTPRSDKDGSDRLSP
jgi:hypothetical protein